MLQSTGKFIEVWDRTTYDKMNNSGGDFALRAEELLGRERLQHDDE